MALIMRWGKALRGSALAGHAREYGVMSDFKKKTKEALDKTKDAAEELQKAASAAQKVAEEARQQAARATSALGEKVSQATASVQELAKETVKEMVGDAAGSRTTQQGEQQQQGGGGAAGEASTSASGGASEQQQQQQEQQEQTKQQQQQRPSLASRLRHAASAALHEMRATLSAEAPAASALRGPAKGADLQASASSDIMITPAAAQSGWQKQWSEMRDKLGSHPMFKRVGGLKDTAVFEKGRDMAEGLRERWETSESPLVHRIQDAKESFFAEGEPAQALREIRARDPSFDMVRFLGHLRHDVPVIIKAYLEGEEGVIKEHCSPEMVERLTGIIAAQRAAGLVPDATLLDTSDVELVDLKMLDDSPVLVTQFTCQQINCTRDSFGNVVEGAPDEVHRVYYYWALQQEAQGYVGTDGAYHPPRWQLREMLIRGMHHLL